ncbi:hypothetical protein [Flavobacterium psychrotrophum]|uniref:hypothetical protein n=1 Tax=Flavobacterium psychrotrophum TaxID=2294119 RepID=UPI0013C463B6|nr:hypothetical protein [Flavobacterium psychrotrophum]
MKKIILTLALLATVSTTLVSCTADDIQTNETAGNFQLEDGGIKTPPVTPRP